MFWKRFYFVVVLLSCNCFFLTCEWLCELFCCGSSKGEGDTYSELNSLENNSGSVLGINDFYCSDNEFKDVDFSKLESLSEIVRYDYKFSCIFLCAIDCAVGKTSILNMAKNKNFKEEYTGTIGFDYTSYYFKSTNNNLTIILQTWDTTSKKIDQSVVEPISSKKNAFIFVYDITNKKSLDDLVISINNMEKKCEANNDNPLFFLLGNKLDLADTERQVTIEDAQKLAEKNGLIFLGECSAKEDIYIPNENTCYKEGELEKGKCPDCVMGIFKDILYNIVNKQKSQGE